MLSSQFAYIFSGAEEFADDGGMILSNIDMGYLGVHSIWTNDLGKCSEVPEER